MDYEAITNEILEILVARGGDAVPLITVHCDLYHRGVDVMDPVDLWDFVEEEGFRLFRRHGTLHVTVA